MSSSTFVNAAYTLFEFVRFGLVNSLFCHNDNDNNNDNASHIWLNCLIDYIIRYNLVGEGNH